MFSYFNPTHYIPDKPDGDKALFNFKWQKAHIQSLHDLAKARGTTASAIIKHLLLKEITAAKKDHEYED